MWRGGGGGGGEDENSYRYDNNSELGRGRGPGNSDFWGRGFVEKRKIVFRIGGEEGRGP